MVFFSNIARHGKATFWKNLQYPEITLSLASFSKPQACATPVAWQKMPLPAGVSPLVEMSNTEKDAKSGRAKELRSQGE